MPSFLTGKGKQQHPSNMYPNTDGGSSSARSTPPRSHGYETYTGEVEYGLPHPQASTSTAHHRHNHNGGGPNHHLNPIIPPSISVKLEPVGIAGAIPRLIGEGTKDSPLFLDDTDSNSNVGGSASRSGAKTGHPRSSRGTGTGTGTGGGETSPKPIVAKKMKMANGDSVGVDNHSRQSLGGGDVSMGDISMGDITFGSEVVTLAEPGKDGGSENAGGKTNGKLGASGSRAGSKAPVSDNGDRKRKHASVEEEVSIPLHELV